MDLISEKSEVRVLRTSSPGNHKTVGALDGECTILAGARGFIRATHSKPCFFWEFQQKGTLWGPHFCVGVIFQVLNAAMRPDRFLAISTMMKGG